LKNLIWTLFRAEEGNLTRMPELMQILEDRAEYVIRIEGYKRKRPNTPGSSKRKHFERANQKRGRKAFDWSPPQDSQKTNPRGPVKGCPEGRRQAEGDESRFIWKAPDTEPHVEPPRPEGWKPLVLTPKAVKKICDQRLDEWSKDQDEYMEREFQRVEERKRELRESRKEVAVDPDPIKPQQEAHQEEPREEEAVDPGSREEHYQRARKLLEEITEENRDETKAEIMKLQMEAVEDAQKDILAERAKAAWERSLELGRREIAERPVREREEAEKKEWLELCAIRGKAHEIKRDAIEQSIQRDIHNEMYEAEAEHAELSKEEWAEINELRRKQEAFNAENRITEVKAGKFERMSTRRSQEAHDKYVEEKLAKCPLYQENRRMVAELQVRIRELMDSCDTRKKALGHRRKAITAGVREKYAAWL
jgi:hypothetical protein